MMSAKASDGVGTTHFIGDADVAVVTVITPVSTDGTLTFQGSDSENPPNFASTKSASNNYFNPQLQNSGDKIDADDGVITPAGAIHERYSVNVEGVRWLNAIVANRTAGSYTVLVTLYKKYNNN